ncbi:MAG: hypothetical protein IID33_09130 [Planctomycetes bacterium]|nr:hypothetical protein [Planctomycetota bacterium]
MDMDTAKQARQILGNAETRMRELIGSAATAGDYEQALRITNLAQTLGDLAEPLTEATSGQGASPTQERAPAEKRIAARRQSSRTGSARARPGSKKNGEYPKFYRRGEQLVKVGWSKKEREEYEHKAPLVAAKALASAIEDRSGNGSLFTAEELFPLKDLDEGSEFPGYQGYVVLAWFRAAGLIEQHGRSGYTASDSRALANAVRAAWSQLPEKPV